MGAKAYSVRMANSRSGDSVIERLVRVLSTFDAEHTEQSPSDIARRAGLPASTGHRVVADLVDSGLLERTENGRAITRFNERVAQDPRVEQVLVPLRDGLTLIRRVDAAAPC